MDVVDYLQKQGKVVDERIDELISEEIKPKDLGRACRHLIDAGGKRLRPVLTLTSCEAVGGNAEDVMESAAALEILHTFTLIHDDVMDRDDFRRGIKTVHLAWGEPMAIIAGDALFAKVFEVISANAAKLGLSSNQTIKLFETVSKAVFEICQGQALDMRFEDRDFISEEMYMEMAGYKTASLFEACTKIGALLGGGGPDETEVLARYGRLLGIGFQIYDDVLDVVGDKDKVGKSVGSDIREGKCTLVMVYAMESCLPEDRERLFRVWGKGGATKDDVREAIEILRGKGAIGRAMLKARKFIERAKSELEELLPSEAKQILIELADFSIERER